MKFCALIIFLALKVNAQTVSSVYFLHNSSDLNSVSKNKLDSLSQLKGTFKFKIVGNCDSSGTDDFNKNLSEKRAEKVSDYLKNKKNNVINIESTAGFGEEKQINDNSSEELRAKNRRVDIFIDKIFKPDEKISRKTPRSLLDVSFETVKVKDTFLLPKVHFMGGRHFWLPEGKTELEKLLKLMKNHPTLEIELQGHICCDYENFDGEDLDTKTFNLSFTRADAVRNFLLKYGIQPQRVSAKGLGHLDPLVYPENTEADRSKNRRVEIVVLKK